MQQNMTLLDESESIVESKQWSHTQARWPVCKLKWIKNNGAVLIVIWSFLIIPVYYLVRASPRVNAHVPVDYNKKSIQGIPSDDPLNVSINGIILLSMICCFLLVAGSLMLDLEDSRQFAIACGWCGLVPCLPLLDKFCLTIHTLKIKTWVFHAFCIVMVTSLVPDPSSLIAKFMARK